MRYIKSIRKQAITLLEVLIALGLLAIVAGMITFKVREWIEEQRSLNEMNDAAHLIATLQDLMLIANVDSSISFEKSAQGLIMKINPLSGVPYYLIPEIHQKPYLFKHLKEIQFEEGTTNMMRNPPFALSFISKGFLMNRGILHFKSPSTQRKMLFLGYPAPFKLSQKDLLYLPMETEINNENERMTLATFQETK